ncbi:Uncharacterized protein Rs2_06667 [Raphanus sativus]|uniref:Uncharacterized protein LOC130499082 n=1 Tax=Raphanus sativus TaxID=3726 RepID=A0A9W3CBL6_RAPSA|nr:uncharacterized protein LOC130499082 [Raphanus sativus]XP_056848969.1 uncharacterized protein LOC130499082 [Raphanus sativus]KAJ4912046.1 Uncharacterized protein Rs2_06667 [Raphanus sativus]
MEENSHRVSRRNDVGTHCQNDVVDEDNRRQQRHYNHHTHGDEDKCSGKRCRSWAAGAIADCLALCCCPCAIINFLTLTFVKVPWMIGRRCLGGRRKKKNKRRLHERQRSGKINGEDGFQHHSNHQCQFETAEEDEKCGGGGDEDDDNDHRFVVERDGSLTKEEEEEKKTTSVSGSEESRTSAKVEAERVWLELYQIGHLGFGRVSFTEIQ